MLLLVLDTETTGVDPNKDRVIEIAAALYETQHRMVLWQLASLVPGPTTNPAQHVNGIPETALPHAHGFFDPYEEIAHYVAKADAVLAHNADFDRRMIEVSKTCDWPAKPWICTQRQIVFPKTSSSQKLTHLAADHGIVVVGAHRAMADVMLIVSLLRHTPNIEEQVKRAFKPQGIYMALVPFERKDEAKERGFAWNKSAKRWEKPMPIDEADAALAPTADRPFHIKRVG